MESRPAPAAPTSRFALDHIQRSAIDPVGPRATIRLDLQRLSPVVRLAHRITGGISIAPRIIFDHELVLILAGLGEFSFGKQRLAIAPHTLFFVPPFTPHAISCPRCEHVAVHFDLAMEIPPTHSNPARRAPYRVQLGNALRFPRMVRLNPQDGMEADCLGIVRALAAVDPLASVEASALLLHVLIRLLRVASVHGADAQAPITSPDSNGSAPARHATHAGHARGQQLVRRIANFIGENFAQRLGAEDLAARAGLSESQFNRLFRQHIGYAPMEYLRRLRVQRARELLADVDLSVKEVAARTGFEDAYHFSRVFRQIAGMSPSTYRDAVLVHQAH